MIVLLAVTATPVLPEAAPALAAAVLALIGAAFVMRHFDDNETGDSAQKLRSPLDLVSVLRFALFLGATIIIGRIVADAYGQAGLLPFAATSGLADVDAVTLAAGSLVRGGLDPAFAAHAVMIAVFMNTPAKGAIAVVTGGWRYASYYLRRRWRRHLPQRRFGPWWPP